MPSLKFSVDPLYTFPGPAQTSFPVVGPARYLRGVCGAGTGAAPSLHCMGSTSLDTAQIRHASGTKRDQAVPTCR